MPYIDKDTWDSEYEQRRRDKKQKKRIWTLERSLQSIQQKVEINHDVALSIAHIINDAAQKLDVKECVCDAGNITEENLKDLITLANINLTSEDQLDNNAE